MDSERAALLQSVDMHRSENRRLLEVWPLARCLLLICLISDFPSPPLPSPPFPSLPLQESTLLKDTLREAQSGDMGAITRAMLRLSKAQQPAKEPRCERLEALGLLFRLI